MRARLPLLGGAAIAASLLATAVAISCAGSKASQGPAAALSGRDHPQVDTGLDTCAGCHAQVTPRVAAQWRDGRHGMALVECFVCHGSTGTDFRPRPEPAGCRGCHPAQVASVTREGTTQSCFACHQAHALHAAGKASPHHVMPAKEVRP